MQPCNKDVENGVKNIQSVNQSLVLLMPRPLIFANGAKKLKYKVSIKITETIQNFTHGRNQRLPTLKQRHKLINYNEFF